MNIFKVIELFSVLQFKSIIRIPILGSKMLLTHFHGFVKNLKSSEYTHK